MRPSSACARFSVAVGDIADRLNVDQLGELGAAELLVSARFSFARGCENAKLRL